MQVNLKEVEIKQEIGRGAFSYVYAGVWKGKKIAVKVYRKLFLKSRKIFDFESGTYSNLSNLPKKEVQFFLKLRKKPEYTDFLVKMEGYVIDPKKIYVLMEFSQKGQIMKFEEESYRFTQYGREIDTQSILLNMAQSVNFLHSLKIIHGDIKIDNFLIFENNKVKLIDFNSFQDLNKSSKFKQEYGTYLFSPPEVSTKSIQHPNPFKYDIWALGVVFYLILTEELPFTTTNKDLNHEFAYAMATINQQLSLDKVPEKYQTLIAEMMNKKPEKRPNSSQILNFLTNLQ